mmetsp:Transcript_2844/g.5042  ORF Transcript_2844/g.5042 Transcript_2844/m.5042 type:complete len:201 (+) Transcript_2844:852-1454(+)
MSTAAPASTCTFGSDLAMNRSPRSRDGALIRWTHWKYQATCCGTLSDLQPRSPSSKPGTSVSFRMNCLLRAARLGIVSHCFDLQALCTDSKKVCGAVSMGLALLARPSGSTTEVLPFLDCPNSLSAVSRSRMAKSWTGASVGRLWAWNTSRRLLSPVGTCIGNSFTLSPRPTCSVRILSLRVLWTGFCCQSEVPGNWVML